MEIHADFWPGQRLSKKLCGRRGLYVSFSTAGLHPGSWINRLSVSREKFHVTIYVEKARVLRSNLTMFRPCYVWKYYEWFWEVLWLPRKSFIVWFTESVDRQISGMCGWARLTRKLCAKHKNASWVFSLVDFVLESLFCAQKYFVAKSCYFCERTLPSIATNNAVIVQPQLVTFNCFPFHLDVKLLKCNWKFL